MYRNNIVTQLQTQLNEITRLYHTEHMLNKKLQQKIAELNKTATSESLTCNICLNTAKKHRCVLNNCVMCLCDECKEKQDKQFNKCLICKDRIAADYFYNWELN
ncbi:putative RING finger domain-containing protein [Tetraselmis virus 1]|uniref:Putative RING finger domain-containing protein n=1 Tax=Tetraselmis virus 1 TaxID=2060617 RepID=A0A2P0VMU5_9VIRU|nr:putative RING finger domain-containing protein [Tetraselmis virus 1]AUF82227.1 putative RING finger domain-containing protein [Tetraselmis virus 1]